MRKLKSIEVRGQKLKPKDKVSVAFTMLEGNELVSKFLEGQVVEITELFEGTILISIRNKDDGEFCAIAPDWIVDLEILK